MAGRSHTFQIHLTHKYRIPEDTYTLLGTYPSIRSLQYWVVGRRLLGQKFEKVSVFQITDYKEGKRLVDPNLAISSRNILV